MGQGAAEKIDPVGVSERGKSEQVDARLETMLKNAEPLIKASWTQKRLGSQTRKKLERQIDRTGRMASKHANAKMGLLR